MARIKVDLHDIYNNSVAIDKALQQAFDDAIKKKIREVEISREKEAASCERRSNGFYNSLILSRYITASKMTQKILEDCLCTSNSE